MKNLYDVHNSELLKNNNDISVILIKDLLRSKYSNRTFQSQIIRILGGLETVDLLDVRTIVSAIVKETKLQKPSPTVSIKKAPRLQDWSVQAEQEKRLDDREIEFHDTVSDRKYLVNDEDSYKNESSQLNENKNSMINNAHKKFYYEKNRDFEENKTNKAVEFSDFNSESFDLRNDKQDSNKFHLENSSSRLEKYCVKNKNKRTVKNSKDFKRHASMQMLNSFSDNDYCGDQAS